MILVCRALNRLLIVNLHKNGEARISFALIETSASQTTGNRGLYPALTIPRLVIVMYTLCVAGPQAGPLVPF